ncbi:hypothetical protein Tco_0888045 [Tanacetum coccineum]
MPREVTFTKTEGSPTETIPHITSDFESKSENQEPLPPLPFLNSQLPLPKLSGDKPIGTSSDVLPPVDLT